MKAMIKHTFTWILILTLTVVQAQDQQYPSAPYLRIASENNPELKAVFNRYLAELERLPQARSLPDPKVMFNIFTSPVETRVGAQKAGIAISQAFPWFGQLKSQEQAVAQLAKARYEVFTDTKNRLFFDVRTAYYDLYVLEAAIGITNENLELLGSFRELAGTRLESGRGNAVDLLRVEMDLEELRNQLLYLEDSRLPVLARFKELLNSDSITSIQLPDTLNTVEFSEGKSQLVDSIALQNPLIRQFDYQLLSLDAEIDVARKMGLPSFNLGLAYTSISPRTDVDIPDNGRDALIFPQVGVSIPIFRKKYLSMVRQKELVKTSVAYRQADKKNELETALEGSWRDYADAIRRVALYQRLLLLAQQSLDILVAQYTSAGNAFEEVLRMERQLLRYELELEKARADQNTQVAYMKYLTGKEL